MIQEKNNLLKEDKNKIYEQRLENIKEENKIKDSVEDISSNKEKQEIINREDTDKILNKRKRRIDILIGLGIGFFVFLILQSPFVWLLVTLPEIATYIMIGIVSMIVLALFWFIIKNKRWYIFLGLFLILIILPMLLFGGCFVTIMFLENF